MPFQKPKNMASVIIAKRSKSGETTEAPENEMHPKLMEAASHMLAAVHAKDATKVAEAMRMAHEHLSPKEEAAEGSES